MLLNFGLGKQIKALNLGWALGLLWGGNCGVMGPGAVECRLEETNKNSEFGLGAGIAVRGKTVDSWGWVLSTYGSGNKQTQNLGWVLEVQ